jgi:hypothetical protein
MQQNVLLHHAMTGYLHTWGQNLLAHPPIHCVIPARGISADHTRWVHPRYPDTDAAIWHCPQCGAVMIVLQRFACEESLSRCSYFDSS